MLGADLLAGALQRLRLLRRVRVIGPGIDLQLLDHLVRQLILRQHSADRVIDQIFRFSLFAVAVAFESQPGIAGVPGVMAVIHLFARHRHLFGVDHDHKITAIDMRSVLWTVFAHQHHGDVTGQSAEHFVARVDDMPLLFDLARLGHEGWLSDHSTDLVCC